MFLLEEYLAPISDELPTGNDPRADVSPTSTYYALKDLRNKLRADERNALVEEEGISSLVRDWLPLLEQTSNALKNESKDIDYVAWYIESLCRLHGFEGLAFGFKVATELLNTYWDDIYPSLDPDDELSDKLSALIGLNGISNEGALIIPIKSIYLTDGVNEGPFTFWEYQQAYETSRLSEEKREKKLANGALNFESVENSCKETSKEFFLALKNDIEASIENFAQLSEAMDRVTNAPQPTSYIKKALDESLNALKHIAADKLAHAEAMEELAEESTDNDDAEGTEQIIKNTNRGIETRADAIAKLQEISAYFRKTEPHSPMSYTIEQVIRWSDLTLPELLNELITDSDARSGYFKLSGIKVSENEN